MFYFNYLNYVNMLKILKMQFYNSFIINFKLELHWTNF